MSNIRSNNPEIQDWSGLVQFQPKGYYQPKNLKELKSAIKDAVKNKTTIRVLAGLHSCSGIFKDVSIINLEHYPRTIKFNKDATKVDVSAHYGFADFLKECAKFEKSICATGGVTEQTLAGLISTDTAPATPRLSIYQNLEWVEFLTYDIDRDVFEIKKIKKQSQSFRAVVCSLGAIGVLLDVCFELIDQPYFKTIQKVEDIDGILKNLTETSKKYDFWRIDWIPKTGKGLLWAANQIPRDQADPTGTYEPDPSQKLLLYALRYFGYRLNWFTSLVYKILIRSYKPIEATGPLRNMLPVDNGTPLLVAMAEWSFNPADLDDVIKCCRKYFKQKKWPNLPIEIELTKTDSYYMSPWNWEGLDYILKFNFMYLTNSLNDRQKQGIIEHLHGLWDSLTQQNIKFRAHWGKINFMTPEYVKENYDFDKFSPFIQDAFLNQYLKDRFPK